VNRRNGEPGKGGSGAVSSNFHFEDFKCRIIINSPFIIGNWQWLMVNSNPSQDKMRIAEQQDLGSIKK
jgi:hypothetical protein